MHTIIPLGWICVSALKLRETFALGTKINSFFSLPYSLCWCSFETKRQWQGGTGHSRATHREWWWNVVPNYWEGVKAWQCIVKGVFSSVQRKKGMHAQMYEDRRVRFHLLTADFVWMCCWSGWRRYLEKIRIYIFYVNTYLTARMCMGCDRLRPAWGEPADEGEEEGRSGETWLSVFEWWPCCGRLCWWWWECWCEDEVCPLCSSGADSVCWPLQVEYRLSSEEFMSFTRASKSTSSSGRGQKHITEWKLRQKKRLKSCTQGVSVMSLKNRQKVLSQSCWGGLKRTEEIENYAAENTSL